ncbi:MAG: diaminopimelate epimerase [Candidatus Cyclobacteriaceae bacterium M2_1C_046]
MKVEFKKYQATGNDFVLIDNREEKINLELPQIMRLCNRSWGIGSDGLILIEPDNSADFKMNFYNPDGSQSLCGNGSRCAVKFARELGIIEKETTFSAFDGIHWAEILKDDQVRLKMQDVKTVRHMGDGMFVDTGSPHVVNFVINLENFKVRREGKKIRNSGLFHTSGVNVNFVEVADNHNIYVRTYERGVEDETLSCGTGVTAAAIASQQKTVFSPVVVKTRGGELQVEYNKLAEGGYEDVFLIGPAEKVFEGIIEI